MYIVKKSSKNNELFVRYVIHMYVYARRNVWSFILKAIKTNVGKIRRLIAYFR